MMRLKTFILLTVCLLAASNAHALVYLTEIHADPASDIAGDANSDGVRDGSDDEFLEILNYDDEAINISGWQLTDGVGTRHVFPSNTYLQPYSYLVVWGGGSPAIPGINWQLASSGSLGLNNSGDLITLLDLESNIIDQVNYDGLAGNDQSIVRFPENGGSFALHSSLAQANGALYSPGTSISGQPFANAAVPEPMTLVYVLSGSLMAFGRFNLK